MKKIEKVGEGAYFVPSYSIPNVQSRVPGMMNYGVTFPGNAQEDVSLTEDDDTLRQEGLEEVLKRVGRPLEPQPDEGKG